MKRAARRALLLAGVALAGCTTLPQVTEQAGQRVRSGRFSVVAEQGGRSENAAGRFTLRTAGDNLTLDLSTPLGTTLARLERTAQQVRLTALRDDGGLHTTSGGDADALMMETFGWSIPVDGLADWIEGRPAPQPPARLHTAADGSITSIEQSGWTITVDERFGERGPPRRLRAVRPPAATAPALTLRLVLDDAGRAAQ